MSSVTSASGPRRPPKPWRLEQSRTSAFVLAFPLIVIAGALIIYPLVRIVMTAGGGSLITNLENFFANSANLRVLRVTFVDSAIVTLLAVGVGAVLAWSMRTSSSRLMRILLLAAIFLPFWMGSVTKIYALTVILERFGVLNRLLTGLGILNQPIGLLYNQSAVIIGMTYQMIPFAFLPLFLGFLSIDLDLVRAAESLGAPRLRAVFSIVPPLAFPSIFAAAALTFVISIGFYLTPVLLGGASVPFSATLISQNIFEFFDLPSAAIAALLLLVSAGVVLGLAYIIVGKRALRKALG